MTNDEITRALARSTKQEALQVKIRDLIEEVNGGSERDLADAIVGALSRSHRTLQQSFMGAIKLAIHGYAAQEDMTDLRNEEARRWSREVARLKDSDMRFPRY